MSKISHKVAEFLEAFLSRRPPPGQLVEQGILQEAPTAAQFFGLPLTQVPKRNNVPTLVWETCAWLQENRGLSEEGLFRVPGTAEDIKTIKREYDSAGTANLTPYSAHTVAGVLKLYFREMPEPLMLFDLYSEFLAVSRQYEYGNDRLTQELIRCLQKLPEEHFALAVHLLRFLRDAAQFSAQSKMGIDNLAMVFAPNVLRARNETLQQIMEDTNYIKIVLRTLIEACDRL